MNMRSVFKIILIVLGAGFAMALLHSGASFQQHILFYGISLFLMLGGTVPKQSSYMIGAVALIAAAWGTTYGQGTLPLGLAWVHIPVLLVAGIALFLLGQPLIIHLWKCPRCYWEGPSTKLRYGHCPHCGYAHVKDAHRSIMTGT